MIGLPTETYEDLQGIVDLANKIVDVYYSIPKEERTKRSLAYKRSKHPEHFNLTEEQKQNLSNAKKRYYGSIR